MHPLSLLVTCVAGWMNAHQQALIEYLQEEVRVRYPVFFVIRLASRAVKIAGIVPEPTGPWMKQMARNLTDGLDGFLNEGRYFIHDRLPEAAGRHSAVLLPGSRVKPEAFEFSDTTGSQDEPSPAPQWFSRRHGFLGVRGLRR